MRLVLICLGLVVSLLCTPPAMAQSYRDRVIQNLTDQGFSNFRVRRTWLGYDQIIALGPDGRREVVLNPKTGAIQRDYLYTSDARRSGSAPLARGDRPPEAADAGGTAPPDARPDADPPNAGAPGQQDKDGPPGKADKDDPPGRGGKGDPPGRSDDKPGADPPGHDRGHDRGQGRN